MGKLRYFLRSAFFLVHAAFFSVLGAQTSKSLFDYPENIFSVSWVHYNEMKKHWNNEMLIRINIQKFLNLWSILVTN